MRGSSKYLQCDSETVIQGIEQSGTAQYARLHFRPFGAASDVGEPDRGEYRQLDCKAVSYVRLGEGATTLVFETDDGERFVYASQRNVIEPTVMETFGASGVMELHVSPDEMLLARETEEGLEPVGCDVVFSVIDNQKMSPQLPPRDERPTPNP